MCSEEFTFHLFRKSSEFSNQDVSDCVMTKINRFNNKLLGGRT